MARRVGILAGTLGLALALAGGCTTLRQEKPAPLPDPRHSVQAPAAPSGPPAPPAVPSAELMKGPGMSVLAQALYPGLDQERPNPRLRPPKLPAAETVAARPDKAPDEVAPVTVQPVVIKVEPPPDDPVVQALRCFLNKRPDDGVKALGQLDKPNQEMLLGLLPLVAEVSGASLDRAKPQELAAMTQQLESLALPLRGRLPVRIDKLCFCEDIKRFGCYDPVPSDLPTFLAASEERDGGRVMVYAEISNFTTQQEGPEFVACLASSVEVRNYAAEKVWSCQFPTKPDRSRTARRDYFINYYFYIPRELKPGHYSLWVQVQDAARPALPAARRSLDFRVVAPGSRPGYRRGPGLTSKSGGGGS